jgi:hypothetical protein
METQIKRLVKETLDRVDGASTYEQFSEVLWGFLQEAHRLLEANGLEQAPVVEREVFDTILRKSVPRGF